MEFLEYLVTLRGAKEGAADMDVLSKSTDKVKESMRGIAGIALGGLGIFAGFEGLKGAVEGTQKLAVTASSFAKVTGMNVNASAQWIAVANAYGISNRSLGLTFKTLSTQTENALGGTAKSVAAFKALGISTDDLRQHSGNLNDLLGLVADKFNKMPGGVAKTQIATQLFGRNWQQLIPLLSQGSAGLEDLRKTAAAYGITLGGDPLKNAAKLHEAEVKLQLAQTGLQVQLSEKLAPAFIFVMGKALDLYQAISKQVNPTFQDLSKFVRDNATMIKELAAVVLIGVAAWRAFLIIKTVATSVGIMITLFKAWRAGTLAVTAAQIGLDGALLANPIGLVIIAIAALVAGLIVAYNKLKWFRDAVNAVWAWLGKLPGQVASIGKNLWDGLKGDLVAVINWIGAQWNSIPFVHGFNIGPVHVPGLPTFTPIGSTPSLPAPGTKSTASNPGTRLLGPGAAHQTAHATAAGGGDVVIKIGADEFARIAKKTLWRAMAANA